jgi:hypothetical protein
MKIGPHENFLLYGIIFIHRLWEKGEGERESKRKREGEKETIHFHHLRQPKSEDPSEGGYREHVGPPVWTDETDPTNHKEEENREEEQHPPTKTLCQQKNNRKMLSQQSTAEN